MTALSAALDDALTRLVPALADQTGAVGVRQALAAGTVGLAARDRATFDSNLGGARAALDRYEANDGDAPIVESLRLVLGGGHGGDIRG